MRTVSGRTDHVVVVGAGLGGLSAALRLTGSGRRVTVLERESVPGGRAGVLTDGGYTFDTGPSVLTMPGLIADALACVGESMTDWLDLMPVRPLYRARFADGSSLDVHADQDAMAEEIAAVCGPRDAAGYRRYVTFVTRLYELEMRGFIDRNIDSPFGLLTPDLARLAALGGFRRLAPKVAEFFADDRTRRVFSFQSMYAGLSPYDALAIYAVIGYMDSVAGVFFPKGGMHAVPQALAAAAQKHGAELRYDTSVDRVELRGNRAVAVHTAAGERVTCDAVVLNPDLPVARRDLLGRPLRRRLRYSPSCFVLHAGSRAAYPDDAHHTISFGTAWKGVFDDVLGGRLMSDPSFLVTSPSRTDPSLAPDDRSSYFVLFPTPNLDTGGIDWAEEGPRYTDRIIDILEERGWPGFRSGLEVVHATTPLDWLRLGLAGGTPFAAAHTFGQTGPFRPRNQWGENVVFAGSGTQPGVGVPMVLISGRLAAERITGPDN
ncbi:MAG: phytoene desaturase family protein [Sporichthyaceae bacterium]